MASKYGAVKFPVLGRLVFVFEHFPVGKILSLCVSTVVCKDFEKLLKFPCVGVSSVLWCVKTLKNFKVARVWMWSLYCGT